MFLRADELRPGEQVGAVGGPLRVLRVSGSGRRAAVYNLEVQVDHTYHVSAAGVLVHNSENERIPLLPAKYGVGDHSGNGTSVIYEIRGQLNGEEAFYVGQMSTRDRWRQAANYENARNLLLNGKNVTITIRTIDYSGLEEVMKTHNLTEKEARKRINDTAEEMALQAAKRKAGIDVNGGSNAVDGKTYRNLNKPGKGNIIGVSRDPQKPSKYIERYGSTSGEKSRLSGPDPAVIPVCPR
jgi:hypothetical protein